MATHRYDPYLWVHLAGIATVPLWLAICTLGLAVGSPQWPGLELALLALLGVSPALWMQLGRPFYIFSLLALTLKPTALSDDQRRMLTLFQRWWVRGLAVAAPVPLVWLLWELYPRAVVASDITPFAPLGHFGGLAVAAGSFALANLFLQVPVSVLAVMATPDKRFKRTSPYSLDQIQAHFTQMGIPLNRLLPEVLPPEGATPAIQEAIDQTSEQNEQVALEAEPTGLEFSPISLDTEETVEPSITVSAIIEPGIAEASATADEAFARNEVVQHQPDYSEEDAHPLDTAEAPSTAPWSDADEVDALEAESLPGVAEGDAEIVATDSETMAVTEAVAATESAVPIVLEVVAEGDESVESTFAALDFTIEVAADREEVNLEAEAVTDLEGDQERSDELSETLETTVEESELGESDALAAVVDTSASDSVDASDSVVTEDWAQGDEGWEQTTHTWEQNEDWDAASGANKERTVEVAVVRISDPS